MPKNTEKTIVIFRKFRDGDVIALFPCEPGTNDPWTCQSYMHVGQHGSASSELHTRTKPASEQEYRDLKRELEAIGYNLTVKSRSHPSYYQQRRWALGLPTY